MASLSIHLLLLRIKNYVAALEPHKEEFSSVILLMEEKHMSI
jgi:hypothetical protein